ncbi:hypothetical protein EV188_10876 [Actinomycetospora succinea]|uniref:Uncharacterized protein n=1 Tax=Actinomycetospora succinea TaxID=663603 RepID=A0A4R6UZG5_9PSEU|nr:hypothetical protein [Actinomycetospora succinea]TDQ51716.1 hypothetical protein EV188_10876 [Actinomycetospora succinea]
MPYLWSVVVVLAGLVGLGLVVVGLLGPVRRFGVVAGVAREQLGRDVGLINARVAALKVRLAERRGDGHPRTITGTVEGATP